MERTTHCSNAQPRLRIAQISKDFSTNGGAGAYVLRLRSGLEALGYEVLVVHADANVPPSPSGESRQFYVAGFDRFVIENDRRNSRTRIMEILGTFNPDIVHIQANDDFVLEMEIRRSFPAIKSLHVYDFCPSGNKFHHALGKPCQHPTSLLCMARMGYKRCHLSKRPSVIRWHYRRCVEANRNNVHYRKLIVGSEYVKQQAMASGYSASQLEVLPYFTELPVLSSVANECENTILFVGRVVREKGLDYLLSALSLVQTFWHLVVDGDGPDLDRAKQRARRLGLNSRTEFVGWARKEQHLRLYQEASVVVVPSVWPEPFGMVGIEAMSYGKPVVAFNVGGIPDWLKEGETGFLVKPYDVKDMAEKIGYLLEHPDIAHQMGMKGRTRVEREFNPETHITRLLTIYKEVIDGRNQPSSPAR